LTHGFATWAPETPYNEKPDKWPLNVRNVYVEIANEVEVTKSVWDSASALQGGWNLLGEVRRRLPAVAPPIEGSFFPFKGSFRPIED